MKVKEYLNFVFDLKKVKFPKGPHIAEIMRLVRIDNVQNRLIKNLSKGYRQRVGFAQALIGNPDVLILDEPTVGLDIMAVEELKRMMREYADHGHTVFITSHNIDIVAKLCDRVAIINKGKVAALYDLNREPNRRIQLAKLFMDIYKN